MGAIVQTSGKGSARFIEPTRVRVQKLGYRGVQVEALFRQRIESGQPMPTLGELARLLDFYDRAGALRALRRVQRRGILP
jgi:hypothetical protein